MIGPDSSWIAKLRCQPVQVGDVMQIIIPSGEKVLFSVGAALRLERC